MLVAIYFVAAIRNPASVHNANAGPRWPDGSGTAAQQYPHNNVARIYREIGRRRYLLCRAPPWPPPPPSH